METPSPLATSLCSETGIEGLHVAPGRLKGACVLVAEDNMMVAMDLSGSLEEAEAAVLGPAARVRDALELIDGKLLDGAILDVNLIDGPVTPVAEKLIEQNVPIVFCTGTALPPELESRYPGLAVYRKPTMPDVLMEKLAELMGR